MKTAKYLKAAEVAEMIRVSARTVQLRGQLWLMCAEKAADPALPSSPWNGIRPLPTSAKRSLYDLLDVEEYLENSVREAAGFPLVNRLKEASHE